MTTTINATIDHDNGLGTIPPRARCVLGSHRRTGILLHPSSLPTAPDHGEIGPDANRFIDLLADAGCSVWQMLPICPTDYLGSPYQGWSTHAGNPLLISVDGLVDRGWLTQALKDRAPPGGPDARRHWLLAQAHQRFHAQADDHDRAEFADFVRRQAHWLNDHALFAAIKEVHQGRPWWNWPADQLHREDAALASARRSLGARIEFFQFEQFVFSWQWQQLHDYARGKGIQLFGDLPIFIAHDSADVWANQRYFDLDDHGMPVAVAGVPPDYFSATGQRWGNPLYRWDRLQSEGFQWWIDRIRTQMERFDLLRVDHFRGFQAYWRVNAASTTAEHGEWVKAPGAQLFRRLLEQLGSLPLVAEDLGYITPAVTRLRQDFDLPGMRVLQFAFSGQADNPHLPHNHNAASVVYTGTHDNDTSVGWHRTLAPEVRQHVSDYLGDNAEAMPWPMIRAALSSVAALAMLPMQDLLGLGSEHRMNVPGTAEGNWRWRFRWEWCAPDTIERLKRLVRLYGRQPD